jgi:antitoxin ParD1/3/4
VAAEAPSPENVHLWQSLIEYAEAIGTENDGNSTMGMNVNLTPQLEEMVREKVNSGLYTSASEVVREALRLMNEQDSLRATKLSQLRQDIRAGLQSGRSAAWSPDAVKRRGRARHLAKGAAAKA